MEKKNILGRVNKPAISSYHCKTLLFHCYDEYYEDTDWASDEILAKFKYVLKRFVGHLKDKKLEHYFIPGVNLLEHMSKKEQDFLIERFDTEYMKY